MQTTFVLGALVTAGYLAAGILIAVSTLRASAAWRALGLTLAVLALAGHAGLLWLAIADGPAWDVNFINSFALASALIVAVVVLAAVRSPLVESGIVVFPGAAAAVVLLSLSDPQPVTLSTISPSLELHIFSSLLAYALLSIAAVNALLLFVQDYFLRRPISLSQLELLPPLSVLESMLFRLILAGWLVLTLSLATGLMFVDDLLAQHLVHKTVLSILSWLLFGLLLAGRWWAGWRGRRAVNWTLIAMLVLALAYFGSKLILEVLLDRSWHNPPVVLITLD